MRDDLLDAQAYIDWAKAQFPAFQARIDAWMRDNVDVGVKETEPPATHNVIVATEKETSPLVFNVELGAYINAIRSSLDILATALAHRYCVPKPDKAYFPVAASETEFLSGGYKGSEFVKSVPDPIRKIIEALKPYQGGNSTLWAIHQLDIMRKHKRLVKVEIDPLRLSLTSGKPLTDDFAPISTGWLRANEETILCLIRKGAPDYEMKFVPQITINEPTLSLRKPVIPLLNHFADYAKSSIGLFDVP